ncbi:MAG: hypothetical protein JWN56_219 [Sphingobacteriales bacterium]|nr:hypothetical protein [Sphingobacteriales bacterium]
MKEIHDIIKAYSEAVKAGKNAALATIVYVEGSSYRRPGARMLVTDDGQLTGAISGGCLEGDARRKALLAISQQKNKLVTYDTTDDEDNKIGVQLGCNGIVHILFEPINYLDGNNAIKILEKVIEKRENAALVTLFSLSKEAVDQPGTCFVIGENQQRISSLENESLEAEVRTDCSKAFSYKVSYVKEYHLHNSKLNAFIEFIPPVVSLVIFGGGNDAIPLAQMAALLGWNTTVIDGRAGYATSNRFPKANNVLMAKPDDALKQLCIDDRTVFVLMTHNYNYDLAALKLLLEIDVKYVGSLGPKKKLLKMFDDLHNDGIVLTENHKNKIFGPAGLDIGAETSEEIALSIISEIKAVLEGNKGGYLKDKDGLIHNRMELSDNASTSIFSSNKSNVKVEKAYESVRGKLAQDKANNILKHVEDSRNEWQ